MDNVKKGNNSMKIAMTVSVLGLLLFKDLIPIGIPAFFKVTLSGAIIPVVIRYAVEAAIYFSRE